MTKKWTFEELPTLHLDILALLMTARFRKHSVWDENREFTCRRRSL